MGPSWLPEECAIGIDEAGRGPVLGPMVYGCAYCPVSSLPHVASLGFDDSKKLTEDQRDRLFATVMDDERMGWAVDINSPEDLSAQMLSREKVSLNVIALESTARMIQGVLDKGANLVQGFVDTVGDPDKYQTALNKRFPAIAFKVSKKADSLFPIVSAASVVAKVTRDRCLREWTGAEQGSDNSAPKAPLAEERSEPGDIARAGSDGQEGTAASEAAEDRDPADSRFGSGYPGDPETQNWLETHREPVFGFPSLVRFSWKTAQTSMDEGCVPVHWGEEEQEEEGGPTRKKRRKAVAFESCAPQRHSFFRTRQLQLITKGL